MQLRSPPFTRARDLSDVSDEERAFVSPYLTLCREYAPPRKRDLREVFNVARRTVKTGAQWR
jgi:transposase